MNGPGQAMQAKVCGVQTPGELAALDACGVPWAGLWWRLAQGRRNLDDEALGRLARMPMRVTRPVVVTIGRSVDELAALLDTHALEAVQLSGFELPPFVRALRARRPSLRIFKTLHVQGDTCLQGRHLEAYRDAGVDVFIADRFVSKEAPGSTGQAIPPDALRNLLARVGCAPLMAAGGIGPAAVPMLPAGVWGVDVDTAMRGADGLIDAGRVAGLMDAARGVAARSPACA